MSKSSRILILASLVVTTVLTGCGKKRAIDEVYKPDDLPKSLVSTDEDYIYLISVSDSDPRSESSRPHWQSYSKIVKMKFSDASLDVYQVNRDKATKDNKVSQKSVLSIPVKHVDYRCRENSFKECTGSEEKNEEMPNLLKRYFIPDFEKTEILEKSFLPIALDGIEEKCFSKKKQTAVSGKLDQDSFNIEIQVEYDTNISCINTSNIEGIEDLLERMTFKVRYYISMVKVSRLADPNYKEVIYPAGDQSTFGFFTTEESQLDVDNRNTVNSRTVKLDRWSPNKKELVYYLNEEFEKPENAQLKEISIKAGEAVSSALKEAGSPIKFRVQSGTKGMVPENLKNSMIVLVSEPLDSGLLGYGPHASNPATGEILHSAVIMYAGNMKQQINRTWDEVVRTYIESQQSKPEEGKKDPAPQKSLEKSSLSLLRTLRPTLQSDLANIALPNMKRTNGKEIGLGDNISIPEISTEKIILESARYNRHSSTPLERVLGVGANRESGAQSIEEMLSYGSLMEYYSRNNYYHGDVFNFEGAILGAFKGKIPGKLLKPWSQLTATEKQDVINLTLPHVWSVTLIHEIGHTLGLRHNFAGSEDAEHFYNDSELKGKGIDYKIPFSSVMEYPFTDIGALPVMGKYDIAALRYGYSRKVLTKSGKAIDIGSGDLGDLEERLEREFGKLPEKDQTESKGNDYMLDTFMYCTDEHVEGNPGCKRFDAGTNYPEIAQHLINTYETFYRYRNKRNGRRSFSATTDGEYAKGIAGSFRNMRNFFERYEELAERLPLVDRWADPSYIGNESSRKFLKELKDSVLLIGSHFMNVLMEPDQTCVVYNAKTGETAALPLFTWMDSRAAGLNRVNPNLFSCFELNPPGGSGPVLAEFGKPFSNKKAADNSNRYADQIDVRGIWSDKLLASYFLLSRTTGIGSQDSHSANFLNVPELQGPLIVLLKALILDEVEREFIVSTPKGPINLNTYTSMGISHILRPSLSPSANRVFGLSGESRFANSLVKTIKMRIPSIVDRELSAAILENFRVYTRLTEDEIRNGKFQTITASDGSRYYLKDENTLAVAIKNRLSFVENLKALTLDGVRKLEKALGEIETIKEEAQKGAKIEELKKSMSQEEAKSFTYFASIRNGLKAVQQALSGNLKDRDYYEEILEGMVDRPSFNLNLNVKKAESDSSAE